MGAVSEELSSDGLVDDITAGARFTTLRPPAAVVGNAPGTMLIQTILRQSERTCASSLPNHPRAAFGILQPGEVQSMTARVINFGTLPCTLLLVTLDGDPEFSLSPDTPATPVVLGLVNLGIIYAPVSEGSHYRPIVRRQYS